MNEQISRPGSVRNISISNVMAFIHDDLHPDTINPRWETAHGARSPSSVMGLPDWPVENVYLSNIFIHHIGTGTEEDKLRLVEEKPAEYPQWERWGALPAWGLYVRHARNITASDLRFQLQAPDARPCFFEADVDNLTFHHAIIPDAQLCQP